MISNDIDCGESERSRTWPRARALGEVTFVTAITWTIYKALKATDVDRFNISPGVTMVAAGLSLLIVHRQQAFAYGVISRRWPYGIAIGVVLSALLLAIGLLEIALFPIRHATPADVSTIAALGVAAIRVPGYVLCFALITSANGLRRLKRVPTAVYVATLFGFTLAAPLLAIYRGAAVRDVLGLSASLVFCTAAGEELLFRGYMQSRLNFVFGKPWRLLRVSFGPGLLVASMLFGLIHVFNPTRPFADHWEVSWLWGATAAFGGLLFGLLREKSGNIWAAVIVHSLTGLYRGIWQELMR